MLGGSLIRACTVKMLNTSTNRYIMYPTYSAILVNFILSLFGYSSDVAATKKLLTWAQRAVCIGRRGVKGLGGKPGYPTQICIQSALNMDTDIVATVF